jgi:DNA-binding transcriptional MerR regulator
MRIGEVAERSGVSARMLRHYDRLGLLRPTGRTSGNHREYGQEDLERLLHVESLRTLGLPLDAVRRALDDPGFAPAGLLAELADRTRRRIDEDRELLHRLETVGQAGAEGWDAVLRTVRLLRGIGSEHAALRQRAALESVDVPAARVAHAALAEDDPNVAGALRWSLAGRPEAVAVLAAGLAGGEVEVRRRAVAALASVGGPDAAEALRGALDDPDARVRARAVLTLGAGGDVGVLESLVDLVVAGTNDVDAADVLAALGEDAPVGARVLAAYDRVLDDPGGEPGARHRVVQALGDLRADGVRDRLERLADDVDPVVARTARALLHQRG